LSRMLVVVNPKARRHSIRLISALRRRAPSDVFLDIQLTSGAGTTIDLTRASIVGASSVLAVGGDGTVSEVASALQSLDVPLGIIPTGSTNIIAKDLGIPTNPFEAIALPFLPHRYAIIDVGRWGSRSFIHLAGAGVDSWMFTGTNLGLKRRIGWLAYVPPAIRNIGRAPARVTIQTDDFFTEVVSPLVLVANGGSIISPRFQLYPEIRKDDGLLDVLVFTPDGAIPVVRTLARFASRSLDQSPYVQHLQTHWVKLSSVPPLPVQLDGDVVSITPATFTILRRALRVIVPEADSAYGHVAQNRLHL
jgi:diacylglycerol kinase (ATP)